MSKKEKRVHDQQAAKPLGDKKVSQIEEKVDITPQTPEPVILSAEQKRKVKEKLSIAKIKVLRERDEYSYFVDSTRMIPSDKIPTMGVTVTSAGPLIIYNESFTDSLSIKDIAGVLVHEYDHVLMDHMNREKLFNDMENHEIHNYAQDLIINQYNDWIPDCGVTLESVKEHIGIELEPGRAYEYYFRQIRNKLEQDGKTIKRPGGADVHGIDDLLEELGLGQERLSESEKREMAKDMARKMRESGKEPGHLQGIIDELVASQVNWKSVLRFFVGRFVDVDKKATRKRRNRRYGIKEPGKRKKVGLPKIGVMIDASGSVSDEEYTVFVSEIKKMHDQGYEVLYAVSDTEVKDKGVFDIKKLKNRKGYGGTFHGPALEYLDSQEVDVIIAFTDGDQTGDTYVPVAELLWCMTRDVEPPIAKGRSVIVNV